jgi:NAD(P)-dependent dehydrogenase (short-subunit alcohol dehydrogenase family)
MQTILITGSNTGIGAAAAVSMARPDRRLLLACRSEAKARPVLDRIAAAGGKGEFVELDLGDLAKAHEAATRLAAREEKIDLLIENAGLAGKRGVTRDGWELAFGTNHLGHFAFTMPLLPLLERGAWGEAGVGRVIVVSSGSHFAAKEIAWARLQGRTRSLTGLPEYAVSKLCNVLFAAELRRRTRLSVVAVHPGQIASDIWRSIPQPFRWVVQRALAMKPVELGGEALARAADVDLGRDDAPIYLHLFEPRAPNPLALRPDLAAMLWELSSSAVTRATARAGG